MQVSQLNPRNLDISPSQLQNLQALANSLTLLEQAYGTPFVINRGLSSAAEQAVIDPAHPFDAHVKGCAVDIADEDHAVYFWCSGHLDALVELGLWMESRTSAPNHVHLQSYAPKSGNRIFIA